MKTIIIPKVPKCERANIDRPKPPENRIDKQYGLFHFKKNTPIMLNPPSPPMKRCYVILFDLLEHAEKISSANDSILESDSLDVLIKAIERHKETLKLKS